MVESWKKEETGQKGVISCNEEGSDAASRDWGGRGSNCQTRLCSRWREGVKSTGERGRTRKDGMEKGSAGRKLMRRGRRTEDD